MADTDRIIRIIVDSRAAVDGSAAATRALKNIEQQTGATSDSLSRLERSIAGIGEMVRANLLLQLESIGERLLEMAKQSLEAAAGLEEMAEQMGITAAGLQALQFSAVQNGLKLDELQTGIAKFSQKLGEAANGSKPMIDSLDQLGVKILDAQGKLIPTEILLQRVAAAILAIQDPARQTAAEVDFFGKAGAKMAAMLQDIAGGMGLLKTRTEEAGAMISKEAIAKLDKLADSAEASKLSMRALFAENLAGPLTGAIDYITSKMENLSKALKSITNDFGNLMIAIASPGLVLTKLGNALLSDTPLQAAQNAAKNAAAGVADTQKLLAGDLSPPQRRFYERRLGQQQDTLSTANDSLARLNAQRSDGSYGDADYIGRYIDIGPPGVGKPKVKDEGKSQQEQYDKLTKSLDATAKAQAALTAAADAGDTALQQAQIHADAYAKAVEIFGASISETDPKVKSLEDKLTSIAQNKAALSFVQGTNALRDENEVLQKQIDLMGQSPEIIGDEIGMIKARQQAIKDGIPLDSDRFRARADEIQQNETMKAQYAQLKQAEELWSEPAKQALRDIQTTAAGAFDQMLESGKISFDSLGQAFTKTVRQMVAQLLALATVRPVLSMVVAGGVAGGLVSPATAAQMGYPQATNGSGGGLGLPIGGGSGLFSPGFLNTPIFGSNGALPSGFEFSSAESSPYAFADLSGPYGGLGGAPAPLGGFTYGNALTGIGSIAGIGMGAYQLLNSNGSAGSIVGGAGSIIGGGLGLASLLPGMAALGPWGMGIGLGAMVLSSFLGNGGPKIPPMPGLNYQQGTLGFDANGNVQSSGGYASAANSIGQSVLALISATGGTAINGKLYGGTVATGENHTWDGKQWVASPYSQANLLSPTGETSFISGTGQGVSLDAAADALAAAIFRSDVLNGAIEGLGPTLKQVLQQAVPTTTADVQNIIQMSNLFDSFRDPTLANNATAAAQAFDQIKQSMAGVTSFAQQYGLDTSIITNAQNRQEIDYAKNFMSQFATNSDPLQAQLDALDQQKQQAIKEANYLNTNLSGVSAPVDLTKNSTISAFLANPNLTDSGAMGDYINAIYSGTFGRTADASGMAYWQGQLTSGTLSPGLLINAIRGGAQGSDINAASTVGMETYTADINQITESFLKQEKALREQYYSESLSSLEDTIKRLTTGDLSTASPGDVLSGTQATYNALLAQAQAGDINAENQLGGAAANYASAGQSYYASSVDYQNLRAQILADLSGVYANEGGGSQDIITALSTISGQLQAGTSVSSTLMDAIQQMIQSNLVLADAINRNG